MSDSGGDDDYNPNDPLPPSSYFGQNDPPLDDDDEDAPLPAALASALAEFDEDADLDEIPPFANAQNKALDAQVKAKEKKLQQQTEEVDENTERVGIMIDHLKNVEQEHKHTQSLVDQKSREIETEDHLKQLAERELGRVVSDLDKVAKQMVEGQDSLNSIQNAMFAANEKLEQFKLQMNWNQEELLQWSLAAKQKDEDRAALEKYAQQDNIKIKNLTLKMEKATRNVQEMKANLDNEITESQAVQIELDKTAEEYRQLHVQRQELVKQWNDAMDAMMKRDQAIAATGEQIAEVKKHVRERERTLAQEKEYLEAEETNNKQMEVQIGGADRTAEKKRELLMIQKNEVVQFQDEVSAQRNELEKVESDLHSAKSMNENLRSMKVEKVRRLEEFRVQLEATKKKLEGEFVATDDLSEKAKQVETLHAQHEDRLKQVNKELTNLKESMFKHSRELFNLRKEEADLIAEISGAQGTSRNLQARIHELDQRSLKQQEMLYTIEFQVQQMERKVSHASGKRSLEETIRLNQEIAELQKTLDETLAQHSMISNQVKRLNDDLRAARRKFESTGVERDKLIEKIAEIELENGSSALEVKDSIKKKEQLIVNHDVLKLEVKNLRDTLNAKADDVMTLENRKLELELSMKEREKEVRLHQEVQKAELKSAEEARHNLAMDLKERQIKVEKLQSKYETIAAKLKGPDDNEEHSQAYYIIASAQQREELQREGDGLNQSIRKSEKEIRMLTKTLEHLMGRNQVYRQSFHKADMDGAEAKLKADLEEQHRSVSDNLYKQKSYLREIKADYEERRRILGQLVNNIGVLKLEIGQVEKDLGDTEQKLASQDEQLARASEESEHNRAEFSKARGIDDEEESLEDVYIKVQEQKRTNRVIMNLLANFAQDNPHMREAVHETLEGAGLRLARPGSAGSMASRNGYANGGSRPGSSRSRPGSSRSQPGSSGSFRPDSRGYSRGGPGSARSKGGFDVFPPVVGERPGSSRSRPSTGGRSRPGSGRPPSSGIIY